MGNVKANQKGFPASQTNKSVFFGLSMLEIACKNKFARKSTFSQKFARLRPACALPAPCLRPACALPAPCLRPACYIALLLKTIRHVLHIRDLARSTFRISSF